MFVSHNMHAITRLCPRAILIDAGRVICDGPSPKVVGHYLRSDHGTTAHRSWNAGKRPGNGIARLVSCRIHTLEGETSESLDIREPVGIETCFEVLEPGRILVPTFHLHNDEGIEVFTAADTTRNSQWGQFHRGMSVMGPVRTAPREAV